MPPRSTSAGYSHCGVETRNTRPATSAGDVGIHPNCVISLAAEALDRKEHRARFLVAVKRLEAFGVALHDIQAEALHVRRRVGRKPGKRAFVKIRGGDEVLNALLDQSFVGVSGG